MPRPGLEGDRLLRIDGHGLKALDESLGLDDLTGEQVGAPHQHADLHAPRHERLGDGGHGRRATRVVDSAREQNVHIGRLLRGQFGLIEHADHLLPKDEARARADVAAALAALEDEAPRALVHEGLEHCWRGDVQVGGDAARLHQCRLVGATARDDREGRPRILDGVELLALQIAVDEAQDSDAPGALTRQFTRAQQQFPALRAAHERQSLKGQAAAALDRRAELGHVADARHGTLHHGVARPVRSRQRTIGRQSRGRHRAAQVPLHDRPQAGQGAGHGGSAAGPVGGQDGVLSHRRAALCGRVRRQDALQGALPGARVARIAGSDGLQGLATAPARLDVGAERAAVGESREQGLAAVHAGDARAHLAREGRLAGQGQLPVEHDPGGAGRGAAGSHVRAHATPCQDRQVPGGQQALHQDEGSLLADQPARFLAAGHDQIAARVAGQQGVFLAGRHQAHAPRARAPFGREGLQVITVLYRQEDQVGLEPMGFDGRGGRRLHRVAAGRQEQAKSPTGQTTEALDSGHDGLGVREPGQIEDADGSRPRGGDGQGRIPTAS